MEKAEGTSNRDASRSNNQQQSSQESSIFGSQPSYNSQDTFTTELKLGRALLRDIRENNDINIEEINCEESLFDGGPDFNWNSYAVESLEHSNSK